MAPSSSVAFIFQAAWCCTMLLTPGVGALRLLAPDDSETVSPHFAKKDHATQRSSLSSAKAQMRAKMVSRIQATSGECDLCGGKQDWLFVFGTGRSGSTTILDMLNAIPGMHLSGENYGVFSELRELYNLTAKNKFNQRENGAAYHTAISESKLLCTIQDVGRELVGEFDESATKTIGFKEIRHYEKQDFDFFDKAFPCGKMLFNERRDFDKQVGSWETTFKTDLATEETSLRQKLQVTKTNMEEFQVAHPEKTKHLYLEDFSKKSFNDVLEWVGVKDCKFTGVAKSNKGGNGKGFNTGSGYWSKGAATNFVKCNK